MILHHKTILSVLVAVKTTSHSYAFSINPQMVTPYSIASSSLSSSLSSKTTATTLSATTVEEASVDGEISTSKRVLLDHEHAKAQVYDAISSNTSFSSYLTKLKESITDPSTFWNEEAKNRLTWFTEPPQDQPAFHGDLTHGDVKFFQGGKLNICYNAIDRHVYANNGKGGDDIAMIWEGDEPTDTKSFTYSELLRKVSQIANALKSQGFQKGDKVTIYMPMIAELPMTMLACARIGAVHSVVFAGFSADALAARVSAAKSKFIVTADIGLRGTKRIPLKTIVDDALTKFDCEEVVERVLVYERFYDESETPTEYEMKPKDIRMDPLVQVQRPYCVPEIMDAEDELFILYTSG